MFILLYQRADGSVNAPASSRRALLEQGRTGLVYRGSGRDLEIAEG
jgi:hypothetical protein